MITNSPDPSSSASTRAVTPTKLPERHSSPRPGPLRSRPPRRHFGRPTHPPRRGRSRVEHKGDTRPRLGVTPIPPPAPDTIRIIPLGGVEEVGRNMTALEFGGDIFIVDCGFQ